MKKLILVLAMIATNLFYYNLLSISNGSLIYASFDEETGDFENMLHVLNAKKLSYIKIDNNNITFITSNSKIIILNLDDEQLSSISGFVKIRDGIVRKKTIFFGIVSIIVILFILTNNKTRTNNYENATSNN